ncbi:MAG TPA: hypothetical protein VK167_01715 [Flavipsychrobacter sp.]|nr:hypothetical protein [Flavipsychrobacter sp.]
MKRLLYILAPVVLLAACKDKATRDAEESKELAARFTPIINGAWVMTDYLTDLGKTKSALASYNKLQGVVYMDILTSTYSGDSLYIPVSFNNHEGGGFMAYFRPGQEDNAIKINLTDNENTTNFYELGYETAGKDTMLVLYHYGSGNKLLDKRNFSKITGTVSDDGEPSGFQRGINSVLFEGSYTATDDAGTAKDITLTRDGMVQGMQGASTYHIYSDYMTEEEGYKVDEFTLDPGTKTQKPFIYQFSGDTIRLFASAENAERTKLEKGALKYTLVRKK